jgi:hypothetical protein
LALGLSKIQVCTFVRLYVLPLVTFISCTWSYTYIILVIYNYL